MFGGTKLESECLQKLILYLHEIMYEICLSDSLAVLRQENWATVQYARVGVADVLHFPLLPRSTRPPPPPHYHSKLSYSYGHHLRLKTLL